jgi:cytochrome c-type biogenesis protein
MIDIVNSLIDSSNLAIIIAFLLGVLMSISPCPLATNIAAVAYVSKKIKNAKKVLLEGFFYTLGRIISYTLVAMLIYFGLSGFEIARFLQFWGDKILGPLLIIIALIMLGALKLNFSLGSGKLEQFKYYLSKKGYIGTLLLGVIFALAFCPYSGVLFFGILIPMILSSPEGLLLAPIFAIGSGLPVIVFSFVIAFGFSKLNKVFEFTKKTEKTIRHILSLIFLLVGVYYTYFLFLFLKN